MKRLPAGEVGAEEKGEGVGDGGMTCGVWVSKAIRGLNKRGNENMRGAVACRVVQPGNCKQARACRLQGAEVGHSLQGSELSPKAGRQGGRQTGLRVL